MPDQQLDVSPDARVDDADEDRFAHICRKDEIARAYVTGEAIEALCGKRWVPTRDPDRYPVCSACKDVLSSIRSAGSN